MLNLIEKGDEGIKITIHQGRFPLKYPSKFYYFDHHRSNQKTVNSSHPITVIFDMNLTLIHQDCILNYRTYKQQQKRNRKRHRYTLI